ncbi:MAG: peptidylprolyl isomerase [Paraglaciecola sp.]|nr:peptidylprolyl isomerase [Paraglaciecola sp.]
MKYGYLVSLILFAPLLFAQDEWRTPDPNNLVYLYLETGTVVIELAPTMAPLHVNQFKSLVDEGYYDGLDFYRVIDGFVAQAGDLIKQRASTNDSPLEAEFTRSIPAKDDFIAVQSPDFMAPETGFIQGFAAGRDLKTQEEWLLHCPGNVAMARSNEKDSATSDFYIVIGQATRHLDRNMSSFARVIYGMPAIQALQRADFNNASGVIDEPIKRSKIIRAKLASQLPLAQQLQLQVQEPTSTAVQQRLAKAKTLDSEFFHFKGNGNLDLCYYQLKTRVQDN